MGLAATSTCRTNGSARRVRRARIATALGGRYARIFVGLTQGWVAPDTQVPSVEDIIDHLATIDDRTRYDVPLSGLDEMDIVISAKTAPGLA
jgi:hypothetical protein